MSRARSVAPAPLLLAVLAALAAPACHGRAPQPNAAPAVEAAAPTPVPARVFLFFPGDDTQLHRETRDVPDLAAAGAPRIRTVVEELIAGSQSGLAPAFPWPAAVEAVFVDGAGNAYVDFAAPPEGAVQGSDTEVMLAYAVVNSVVANCTGVQRVQLLFGGREVATLGHLDLSRPLAARPQLVAP